jgi:hypothetical protein
MLAETSFGLAVWGYVQMVITISYFLFFLAIYLIWRELRDHGWPLRFLFGEFWFIALIVWVVDAIVYDYAFSETFLLGGEGASGALILLAWGSGVIIRFLRSP